MIDINVIENFLQRIGVEISFTSTDKDEGGDIVAVFNPDANFLAIRKAVHDYTPYYSKIVDNGTEFLEIRDSIYIDGNRTDIAILVSTGDAGKGVVIKAMVKSIKYVVDGEVKVFTGFRALKEYKERFVA